MKREEIENSSETSSGNKDFSTVNSIRFGPYILENTSDKRIRKVISKQKGYVVRLYLGKDDNGKLKFLVRHTNTRQEALQICRSGTDAKAERKSEQRGILLDVAMENYTKSNEYNSKSPGYRYNMDHYRTVVSKYLGRKVAKTITVSDVEEFFRTLMGVDSDGNIINEDAAIGYKTSLRYRAYLSNIWKFMCHENKYGVSRNIISDTVIPKIVTQIDGITIRTSNSDYVNKSLNLDELNITLNDALLNERDSSYVLMIMLAAVAGLRKSEILGLQASRLQRQDDDQIDERIVKIAQLDVDYYKKTNNLVLIDRAITIIPGQEICKLPKDNKPRVIGIPNVLNEVFKRVMSQRNQLLRQLQEYGLIDLSTNYDYAFYPLSCILNNTKRPANITRTWQSYQERRNKRLIDQGCPEIGYVRLHELRHTHANLLRSAIPSVPEYEISKNMGHSITGSVTRTNYFNDYCPDRRAIIDYFDSHIHLDFEKYDNEPHNFI